MSFFFKFLTGAVIGGSATVYYRDQITSTSQRLSSDLDRLSRELVQSRQPEHSPVRTADGVAMIPKRLPLSEEIKARWNDQLSNAVESVRTTDWSRVATGVSHRVRQLVATAKEDVVEPAQDSLVREREGTVSVNERMVDRIDGKL
ncbi:hypothetical protein JCM11491_001750 [Sporobolomyces phaffii]